MIGNAMKDIRRREVTVGDTLAVAFRTANRATIRIGTVVEIIPPQGYFQERFVMEWEAIGGYRPDASSTTIEPTTSRIVIVS